MVHKFEDVPSLVFEKDVGMFKCLDGCNVSFKFNADLRNHLEKKHGVSNEVVGMRFASYEDFLTWLKIEEKNNDVRYQRATGMKKRYGKIIEKLYFNCARSGKQRIRSEDNLKRKAKAQGSCKLNLNCTSQIIISKEDTGECSMVYFKNHYGHGSDIHHLRLSKFTREDIASKLLMGVPSEHIVDSFCHSSNQQKRDDFLTRKDINNIKKSLNVQLKNGHCHENDATSIDLCIEELVESEQNYESESELLLVSNELNTLENFPQQSPTEQESHQEIVSEIQNIASKIIDDVKVGEHNIDDLKLALENLKAAALLIGSKKSNVDVLKFDSESHSDEIIEIQTKKKNKNCKKETRIIEKFLETALWMSNDPANDHLYV